MAGYVSRFVLILILASVIGHRLSYVAAEPAVSKASNNPDVLTITISDSSPPFHFINDSDEPDGLFVDLWKRWSKETGTKIKFLPASWKETLEIVKTGKADVHSGIFKSKNRETFLDFSVPLLTVDTYYFYHKSIFNIENPEDLMPFKIGVLSGDYAESFLRKRLPGATLVSYPDNNSLFDALEVGMIKVFVKDKPIAFYFLKERDLLQDYKFEVDTPLYTNVNHVAVKKGNNKILKVVNEGMSKIPVIDWADLQRKWLGSTQLKTDDRLKIGLSDKNLPFSGLNFEGKPTGMMVDLWDLWSQKTGYPVEYRMSKNKNAPDLLKSQEVDIFVSTWFDKQLYTDFLISQPIYKVPSNLFYRLDSSGAKNLDQLGWWPIGVVVNSYHDAHFAKHRPEITLKIFDDLDTMLKKGKMGEVRYLLYETPVVEYYLDTLGLGGGFSYDPNPVMLRSFVAAVNENEAELLVLVDNGLNRISGKEISQLESRWMTIKKKVDFADTQYDLRLTAKEVTWLKNHPSLRVGIDPSRPPFDFISDDGQSHLGMASDYVKLLGERLGVDMQIVPLKNWPEVLKKARDRDLDIVACIAETPRRRTFLNFSKPYLSFPWIIITRHQEDFIGGIRDLYGKKVSVVEEFSIHNHLRLYTADLSLQMHSNPLEGLIAVSTGESDAYVGNLVVTSYLIQNHDLANLKVAALADLPEDLQNLRIGIRKDWPQLINILNKGLDSISEVEKEGIKKKWFAVRYEHGLDADYIRDLTIRIVIVVLIIIILILFWNRRLKREIRERTKVENDLRDLTKALAKARDDAQEASRSKSVFLSNMSHEIRTPMNAILGFSQLMLRSRDLSHDQVEQLNTIWKSGEHLLALINNILEMSKIEAGRVVLNEISFDLHSLLDDLEMMFRVRTDAKKLRFSVEKSNRLPRYIKADQGKLRQILINLLGNAVKFTNEGGIVMRSDIVDNSETILFEVEDSGVGISASETDLIFQHFEQTKVGKNLEGGTGLGLAISKKYALIMNGDITVTSEENKGSLFVLSISYLEADSADLESTKIEKQIIRLLPGQLKIRVLVADDHEINRNLLKRTLETVGFEVFEAENGKAAVKMFEELKPHLILMDIVMPEMDGVLATSTIKAMPGGDKVVVFAVTASAWEDEKHRILKSGAVEFIRKPFREAELFERISEHLQLEFEYGDSLEEQTTHSDKEKLDEDLIIKSLQKLPEKLLADMYTASKHGYRKQMVQFIEQVNRSDKNLARYLTDLVNKFDYENLSSLLSPGESISQ